eukprot:TRINITY_DN19289_c0_g1_i10.p1 TRINITY_DN19289_c0_g1~~TRINITY_DN19289_c0_g1_i10.p1  ORF type:complete len:141 (+),score=40.88 TRINITY_DN19289_c0_g1_i10:52-474(+)
MVVFFFFFQAEDGIRDAQESRGLGDVYKRQVSTQSTGTRLCGSMLKAVLSFALLGFVFACALVQGDEFASTKPACVVFGVVLGIAATLIVMHVDENEDGEGELPTPLVRPVRPSLSGSPEPLSRASEWRYDQVQEHDKLD